VGLQVEEMRAMLGQRDAEIEALKTKLDTLDRHQDDHTRHVTVLRQQITAKEEQATMLQTDVCYCSLLCHAVTFNKASEH